MDVPPITSLTALEERIKKLERKVQRLELDLSYHTHKAGGGKPYPSDLDGEGVRGK